MQDPLASGSLSRVAVVVLRPDRTPAERFVLEPRLLAPTNAGGGAAGASTQLDLAAVEAQLRGVLLKLQYVDASLRSLPLGCTFEVAAYTSARGGGVPLQAWVEEQPRPGHLELVQVGILAWMGRDELGTQGLGTGLKGLAPSPADQTHACPRPPTPVQAEIVSIKSCNLPGAFQLQLYAES